MTEKPSDALPGDAEADPVLVELGRRLLRARLRYGERQNPPRSVSQTAVAKLIDVTGVTVGAWEAGKNDAGVPMLYRLADLYGVSRVWLLAGVGEMYDNPARPSSGLSDLTPPLEMFREIQTGDDLRRALGEPTKKKRRGNGGEAG